MQTELILKTSQDCTQPLQIWSWLHLFDKKSSKNNIVKYRHNLK